MSWELINTKYKIYNQWYRDTQKLDGGKMSKRLVLIDNLRTFTENIVLSYTFPVFKVKDAIHLKEEREFLFYRIIDGCTMDSVADKMRVSRDTVYRIRRRIMTRNVNFDLMLKDLYEKEEEVIKEIKNESIQMEKPIVVILAGEDVNIDNIKSTFIKLGYNIERSD